MLAIPITITMADPNLFSRWHAGNIWATWDRGIEGYLWPADDHRRDQDVKKSAASCNPSVESVRELWVIAGREVRYGLNSQPDRRPHRGLQ